MIKIFNYMETNKPLSVMGASREQAVNRRC